MLPSDLDFDSPPAPATKPGRNGLHESFEDARPVGVNRVANEDPALPNPEEHIIAACFLDGPAVVPKINAAGITPIKLETKNLRPILASILSLHAAGSPTTDAAVAVDLGKDGVREIGGYSALTDITSSVPTTLYADHFIEVVRTGILRRELLQRADELRSRASNPQTDLDALVEDFRGRLSPAAPIATTAPRRPLFDFTIIPDSDPSILLGNRYLNRGDIAVLVGSSGMGKSSMSIQMACELALNRGPFGIQGNGPLRSLIIQSEDSEGDVAEVAHSVSHVLKLTDEDRAAVSSRVCVITDRVNRGPRFIQALRRHVTEFKPDLVWINPLQAFIDGDITDARDIGAFLREGLNSLNEPPTFGYFLVHHTTKPATGKERQERQWHEVMYDMAGGAEIINAARAILSLRATETEGDFNLVLAKRGRRAGVTKKVPQGIGHILEPITTIPLRHAQGRMPHPSVANGLRVIFWEGREADAKPAAKKEAPKYQISEFLEFIPGPSSQPSTIQAIHKGAKDAIAISMDDLRIALNEAHKEGHVERTLNPAVGLLYRKRL